jgi:hypothetical protein
MRNVPDKRYSIAWDEFLKSYRRLRKMVVADGGDIQMDIKVKAAARKIPRRTRSKDLAPVVLEAASLPVHCASTGQTGNVAPNPQLMLLRTSVTGNKATSKRR